MRETLATRSDIHRALPRILDRGRRDGTIRPDVTIRDVIVVGALLAQPLPSDGARTRHPVG